MISGLFKITSIFNFFCIYYAYNYLFKLAILNNSLTHYTKGTLLFLIIFLLKTLIAIKYSISNSFNFKQFFSSFPHGTIHYRLLNIIEFKDGPLIF